MDGLQWESGRIQRIQPLLLLPARVTEFYSSVDIDVVRIYGPKRHMNHTGNQMNCSNLIGADMERTKRRSTIRTISIETVHLTPSAMGRFWDTYFKVL